VSKVIAWLTYALSVVISVQYCAQYWVVGPVFGLAYLITNYPILIPRRDLWGSALLFLGASTFTYALVYFVTNHGFNLPWSSQKGWSFKNDYLDALLGSFTIAVVLGSLIMPLFHRLIFATDFKRIRKVWLRLIGAWYAVIAISLVQEFFKIPGSINYIYIGLALWQGIYMRHLCLKRSLVN